VYFQDMSYQVLPDMRLVDLPEEDLLEDNYPQAEGSLPALACHMKMLLMGDTYYQEEQIHHYIHYVAVCLKDSFPEVQTALVVVVPVDSADIHDILVGLRVEKERLVR